MCIFVWVPIDFTHPPPCLCFPVITALIRMFSGVKPIKPALQFTEILSHLWLVLPVWIYFPDKVKNLHIKKACEEGTRVMFCFNEGQVLYVCDKQDDVTWIHVCMQSRCRKAAFIALFKPYWVMKPPKAMAALTSVIFLFFSVHSDLHVFHHEINNLDHMWVLMSASCLQWLLQYWVCPEQCQMLLCSGAIQHSKTEWLPPSGDWLTHYDNTNNLPSSRSRWDITTFAYCSLIKPLRVA